MKVLVTGRNGQLAQSLAERGGTDVILMGRPEIDLAIPGSARTAILTARPDLIVNAAAYTAVDLAETEAAAAQRINAAAAGEVAAAASELAIPIIQVSTDYVFDGRATAAYTEAAATNPINSYGRSKLAGEVAVRAANPDHLIVRTSWLVSPFSQNFVRTMAKLGQQRDTLTVVADQHGNPTSTLDLADAIMLVARRWATGDRTGQGHTYHLVGNGIASWFDLAVAVQDELTRLGVRAATVKPITTAEWPTPAARPTYSALDTAAFTRDFDHKLPGWRTSLPALVRRLVETDTAS